MGTMASWRLAVLVLTALHCLSADGCPSDCRCFLTDDGEDAANCTDLAALSDFTASLQVLYVLSPPETPVHTVDLPADTFQALPHLKYLHLNNASLEQLHPETFGDLKELRYLDVSFNFLSDVGQLVKLIQQLPQLEVLNARGNPFMMLPPSTTLFNSKSLQSLDLGFCGFESIPDVSFKNLSSLEYLYLDGNSLKYVSFASFPKHIRYINLSNNQLEALDIYGLPELEYLHEVELAGSSLQCTCDLLGVRDMLVEQGLVSEKPVVCAEPPEYQGKSWLEVKKETVCQSEAQYSPHRDSGQQRAGAPDSHEMMQGDQPMDEEASSVSQEDEYDDDDESEEDSALISGDSELIPHGDHSDGAVKSMPLLDGDANDENDSETDPQYSDYSDVDTASDASASNDEGSGEPLSSTDASEGAQIMSDELLSSSEVDGDEYEDDDDDPKESGDEDDDDGPEDSHVASIDDDADETGNSSTAAGSDETDEDDTDPNFSDAYVDSNDESLDISSYDSHPADTNESSGEPEDIITSANDTDDEEYSDTSASEDEDHDESTSSNTSVEDVNLESKESDAINSTEEYSAESVSEDDSGGTDVEYKNREKEGADVINLVNTDDEVGKKEQGLVLTENEQNETSSSEETEHERPLTTESSADDNDELKNVFLVAHTNTSSSTKVTEESNGASNEHEVSGNNSDSEELSIMETSSEVTTENNSDSEDKYINMDDDDKGSNESQPISEKSSGELEDSNAGTSSNSDDDDEEEEDDDDDEEEANDDDDSNSALDVGSLLHSDESKSRSAGGQSEPNDNVTESTGEASSTEESKLPDDEQISTEEDKSVADESESEDDGIHSTHLGNEPAEDDESESEEETKAEDDESKPRDEILETGGVDEISEEGESTIEDPEPTDEETDSARKATSLHEDEKYGSDKINEEHDGYFNLTSEEPAEVYEEHIESEVAVGSAHESDGLGAIPDVLTTEEYIDLRPSDEMTTTTYESTEAAVIKSANVAPGAINRNIIIPPNYEDMSRKSGNTKVSINEIGVSGSEDKVSFSEEKPPENSTASFVVLGCIMAAIVALLGYAVVRSRMQKAAEKRRSVEKKNPNMRELKEMRSLLKPDGDSSQHATELASLLSPDSVQVIPNGVTSNGSAKLNQDTPEKTAGPQKPPRNIDQSRGVANLTDVIVEQVPESLRESDVELRRLPADKVGNGVNTVDPDKSQIYQPNEERLSSLPVRARLSDIPVPLKQRPVFITNPGPKTTNELL